MTRLILACLAIGIGLTLGAEAFSQEPAATRAPEPKMPPMPSMEGQQGDVSKPVTQIPARKKSPTVEKKAPNAEKKNLPKAAAHKGH